MNLLKVSTLITILNFLFIFYGCSNQDDDLKLITQSFPEEKADHQKLIVGQLSGKYPLANHTFIKSRWSAKERSITRKYLKQLISTLNIEAQEHDYTLPNLNPAIDLILEPFKGSNIYGVLPASNASEDYIVLGAHFDSGKRNAPGAIDNATGIALIYSIVKEVSKIPHRNKNILMVFFDQEEEELIGSQAFAAFLKDKPWNVHSVHCFDMVGWDSDSDRAMEIFSGSEQLMDVYRQVSNQHNIPLKEIKIDPVGYENSSTDFDAFVPLGFNVIGAGECYYFKDSTPFKDSPDDTFETVNFDYLLSCTLFIEDIIKQLVTS